MPLASDTELAPYDETAPAVDPQAIDQQAIDQQAIDQQVVEADTDDALVEEVSIDGMCGVY